MTRREIVALIVAITLALLAWGGRSMVDVFQRVSTVEAEQRAAVRWMERIDEKVDRLDTKMDRLLRR